MLSPIRAEMCRLKNFESPMAKPLQPKKKPTPKEKKTDTAIIVAIIGLIGTVVAAIFGSPVLIALIQKTPAATLTATSSLTPIVSALLSTGTSTLTPEYSPPQVALTSTATVSSASPIQKVAQPITVANAGSIAQTRWAKPFGAPVSLALSPDGKTLAVATSFEILVNDLANLETPLFKLEGQKGLSEVAFSPDGQTLASAGSSFDGTIWLWDMARGGVKRMELEGHTDAIYSIAFSPNGALLASGSRDNSVRIWDIQTGKELFFSLAHNAEVHSVAFGPDGALLASGGGDGKIRLWDVKNDQEKIVLDAHPIQVECLAFSPDGKFLASAGQYDTEIRLWDTQIWQTTIILRGHERVAGYGIFSLAFNDQGTLLASGGGDNSIRLWDVDPISPSFGKELATLQRHSDWVDSLVFSPDGTMLISASDRDGTIRIWETSP